MGGFAWVTLATNDSYSLGALVLAHSLRRVGTKHDLAVLITPGVTQSMREKLSAIFTVVQEVNVLDSRDEANLALLARPELGITFTKLHCWRLTQYERCVFVDADTLVVRNCDELFDREELSAAPDVGWPDCFNSGVFVFTPSQQTFASLTSFAASQGSFDGGDQGLLNSYFSDWAHKDISKHLPFIYNMSSTATYSYLPAYKQFGEDVRIIHFIGSTKPWLQYFDSLTGEVQPAPGSNHLQPLLQLWWNIFCESVHRELSPVMASTTLALHWHDILLPTAPIPINTRYHVFHDATDRTTDEIDMAEPDFSEFKDPWDNFVQEDFHGVIDHSTAHVEPIQTHHHAFVTSDDGQRHNHDHSLAASIQGHQIHVHHHDSCPIVNVLSNQTCYYEYREPSGRQINRSEHQSHQQSHQIPPPPVDYQPHQSKSPHQTHYHSHEEHRHYEHVPSSHSRENGHFDDCRSQSHQSFSPIDIQSNQTQTQNHSHSHEVHRHHDTQFHEDPSDRLSHITREHVHQENSSKESSSSSHHTSDRLTDNRVSKIEVSTSQSYSQTCTESSSTTTHTEIHSGDVENSDSGIAGALAQLTLGESRSPEQVALEEHMRKYSWEQGQIDYMGRDSFDNIWKKICTTLDATPSTKEKTPVKETTPPVDDEKSPPLPAATATATPPVKGAEEAVPQKPDVITESPPEKLPQEPTSDVTLEPQPTAASQITEKQSTEKQEEPVPPKEDPKESSTPTTEQPSSPLAEVLRLAAAPPLLSLASPPPVLSLTSSPPVLSIKESGEKAQSLTTASPKPKEEDEEKPEESRETVIPLGYTSPTTFESTTSLNLSESEQPQDPEDVPESPVPIQVAESVLEADIKESVSEHIKPVTEEAISSISAPVQESVSAIVEPLEAAAPVQAPPSLEAVPSHPNGTGGFDSDVKSDEDTPLVAASAAVAAPLVQPETISFTSQAEVTPEVAPAEIPEIPEDSQVPEAAPAAEEVAAAAIAAQPSPEVLERLPEPQEKSPESLIQQLPVEEPPQPSEPLDVSPPTESSEETPDPEPDTPEPSPKSTSPEKFPVPRTPTVIEATPPTSPQFELSEGQSEEAKAPKKATKKLVKKMSSEEKTESSEADEAKKPAKKVVKKVVKKPKEGEEGAEGSASMEKPKKVVRIVKKVPKCETLQTDASVPETPPPPTSDTPVPPKRKGKPGTTKPTKKPDSEQ
ncbi:proteoglycan 4 isoform X1 [Diachasma alloeum]|uniref:proteoglycan 4 isoform X1 n=1 Tax=Diachasma alloeum TaxID=454923 RepID=UPI0007384461|nr:proteoglycan 4 isoform X1 [Diachasma alloeum]